AWASTPERSNSWEARREAWPSIRRHASCRLHRPARFWSRARLVTCSKDPAWCSRMPGVTSSRDCRGRGRSTASTPRKRLRHDEDHVAGLVLGFDVARRLDHPVHGIGAVDDRPELALLHEVLEELDVLLGGARRNLED